MNKVYIYYDLHMSDRLISRLAVINGKVLVTGHTGFKGKWLTLLLDTLGIRWAGISLKPKPDSLYNLIDNTNTEEYFVDIRNFNELENTVKSINPRYVIHLAAQPLVLNSYLNPRETFETNILGTVNLLDILVRNSISEKIIIVTTDKVYKEKRIQKSFKEHDAFGGKDPYSWSKVGTEAVVGSWQQICKTQGGPKIVSVRAGNVIGGGDYSENRLLPDLIKGFTTSSRVSIRNPSSTRPWQHVLDPVSGYLLALVGDTDVNAFNFSPSSKSLSVKKVTEIACQLWGNQNEIYFESSQDSLETVSLTLNSSKAKKVLNWSSHWTQEQAVIATVNWWKNVTNKTISPKEACAKDINDLLGRS